MEREIEIGAANEKEKIYTANGTKHTISRRTWTATRLTNVQSHLASGRITTAFE